LCLDEEVEVPAPTGPGEPSQAERIAFVKFARYTALTADKLSGALIALSEKLESAGISDPNRASRISRDQQLKAHMHKVFKSDQTVNDLLKLMPDHPDGESLVRFLFCDLHISTVKLKAAGPAAAPPAEMEMEVGRKSEVGWSIQKDRLFQMAFTKGGKFWGFEWIVSKIISFILCCEERVSK
jgi:hypothetical protein